jgi:hypothetical protein
MADEKMFTLYINMMAVTVTPLIPAMLLFGMVIVYEHAYSIQRCLLKQKQSVVSLWSQTLHEEISIPRGLRGRRAMPSRRGVVNTRDTYD